MFFKIINEKIEPSLVNYEFNQSLEGYRGLCAILVILNHAMCHEDWFFLTGIKFNEYLHYINAGYLSVMVFFCISGYVIGVTNNKSKLDFIAYLKKRAIRLYPIYLFSIILCLLVSHSFTISQLIGNIFFMQNWFPYFGFSVPVFVNGATWSLNYEVLFYFLFGIIYFLKPNIWIYFTVTFLICLGLNYTNSTIEFIAWYFNGFVFWMIGLSFAWKKRNKSIKSVDFTNQWSIISLLFLHLCQNHLGIGKIILSVIKFNSANNFYWLFDLPFCIMILGCLTNTENIYLKINRIIVYLVPSLVFIYLIVEKRIFENERWIMCLIFWVLSILFSKYNNKSDSILKKLSWVGRISYGIYILHIPIAFLVKKYIIINYLWGEIIVKYTVWLIITFSIAYLLEVKLQPKLKKLVNKKSIYT